MRNRKTRKFWDGLLRVLGPWIPAVMVLSLLGAFPAAQVAAQDLKEHQRWIEQIDGGFVFPASSNAASFLGTGYGGDILVGYRFDRNFSLSADLGYYDCDQKGPAGAADGEWIYVPMMLLARFNFGSGSIRPFVLLGAGAAFNDYSETLAYGAGKLVHRETDFLLAPGLGVLWVIGSNAALYIQARADMNFVTNHALDSPASDSPTLFIPLKGGLTFFVL